MPRRSAQGAGIELGYEEQMSCAVGEDHDPEIAAAKHIGCSPGGSHHGDARAELIAIAQAYEKAARRQAPYARLIEEYRLLEGAKEHEEALNERMLEALVSWIAAKQLARGRSAPVLSPLALTVFGSWLFYLGKLEQGLELEALSPEFVLDQWASFWSRTLDGASV